MIYVHSALTTIYIDFSMEKPGHFRWYNLQSLFRSCQGWRHGVADQSDRIWPEASSRSQLLCILWTPAGWWGVIDFSHFKSPNLERAAPCIRWRVAAIFGNSILFWKSELKDIERYWNNTKTHFLWCWLLVHVSCIQFRPSLPVQLPLQALQQLSLAPGRLDAKTLQQLQQQVDDAGAKLSSDTEIKCLLRAWMDSRW